MAGLPWRSFLLALLGALVIVVAVIPDPHAVQLSELSTEELLGRFAAANGDDRRAIIGQLVDRSKTVIPQLESAAPTCDIAQLSGLFQVLEELMLSSDAERAEEAESALERLVFVKREEVHNGAAQVLYANAGLRHARALGKFLEAGGRVGEVRQYYRCSGLGGGVMPVALPPRMLILGPEWSGGDIPLRYIPRLYPSDNLVIHVADAAHVSDQGLQAWVLRQRKVTIRRETESCLGIYGATVGNSVHPMIGDVNPGSPAARAGLRRGDLIQRINDTPVESFDELRLLTTRHRPGSYVELRILRNNAIVRVKLAVGSDFMTGDCQCLADHPAS
jgi:hypothetical protein